MQITIVFLASILALVGNIPYLLSVWKGEVRPHPFSWLVWSIVSCVVFFGAVTKGAGIGSIPILVSEIFTVLIFLFSLKYGFKKIKKVDVFFLLICLLGLITWYLTNDPTISIIIAVSIDVFAFLPTIRKTYQFPETESPTLYASNFLRHILILSSLDTYNIATTLHSIVMISINGLMVWLIKRRKLHFFTK